MFRVARFGCGDIGDSILAKHRTSASDMVMVTSAFLSPPSDVTSPARQSTNQSESPRANLSVPPTFFPRAGSAFSAASSEAKVAAAELIASECKSEDDIPGRCLSVTAYAGGGLVGAARVLRCCLPRAGKTQLLFG